MKGACFRVGVSVFICPEPSRSTSGHHSREFGKSSGRYTNKPCCILASLHIFAWTIFRRSDKPTWVMRSLSPLCHYDLKWLSFSLEFKRRRLSEYDVYPVCDVNGEWKLLKPHLLNVVYHGTKLYYGNWFMKNKTLKEIIELGRQKSECQM